MENEVLISVIVPVYNAEKTIERCINSILNQKFKNVEILVINDRKRYVYKDVRVSPKKKC